MYYQAGLDVDGVKQRRHNIKHNHPKRLNKKQST